MSLLFSPLTIKEITFKNRIVVSPMCQYSSQDGFANDWHLVHLGSRAVGGAALVMMEATAISPEGRISPFDMGIWKDEHITFLERITGFIAQQNCIAGIQIGHAGRKASKKEPWNNNELIKPEQGGWQTVAPSAIPFDKDYSFPLKLDLHGIEKVIDDFKQAAARALKAGFKVLEIHGAHGYLVHEFLSPLSNHRTDRYGGSFENRIRLLIEIIAAVQTVWPAGFPLFVRISATDWVEEGWSEQDSVELSKILLQKGIDLVDCSSGSNIPGVRIPLSPGYQVHLAEQVKKGAGILTGAVGLITTAEQAEEILLSGKANLIFFARQLLRDPYFAYHAASELGDDYRWPVQYERAKPKA